MALVRLERNRTHQRYILADGSEVTGASSICKLDGEGCEALINWGNKLGLKGLDFRKERGKAADSGTIAHFMVDCHLKGDTPDLREFEQKEIDAAKISFDKFLDFWSKEHLTPLAIEKQMVSEVHRYGGTLDLLALDEHGQRVLLDWKTSKAVWKSMKFQVGGYQNLWDENYPKEKIDRRAIIRIGREADDTFQAHWITQEEIDWCIRVFLKQAALMNELKSKYGKKKTK